MTVAYRGHAENGPQYACEVREGEPWRASPLGWCGTGVETHALEPGEPLEFDAVVPCDGRRYRFSVGEPPVWTPEVSARGMPSLDSGTTSDR